MKTADTQSDLCVWSSYRNSCYTNPQPCAICKCIPSCLTVEGRNAPMKTDAGKTETFSFQSQQICKSTCFAVTVVKSCPAFLVLALTWDPECCIVTLQGASGLITFTHLHMRFTRSGEVLKSTCVSQEAARHVSTDSPASHDRWKTRIWVNRMYPFLQCILKQSK